ncbi:hypothetical protein HH682_12215 [Rosenbergiella sp. S61]|uniref:Uncharacterized protein n=1 Tax=Rosenbergiella gaditana TaxID=2726987 RepID=A0ABS5SYI7_9GAMM|nr:hypothetical protein [Rosenbergiella gaditana]MBT0725167.1 hypothetical protein [Rosenbergiella gaditana]
MSVIVNQKVLVSKVYGDLGTVTDDDEKEVAVEYSVQRLVDFDGQIATAEFAMAIDNKITSQSFRLSYNYSGQGNPLDQAEESLKLLFSE